ncbi:hypothetical protein COV94_06075, partial [Candidatus Woesearchaeota archaeon CG11_big_fil_rev_8_21_14_0_20_57_5]
MNQEDSDDHHTPTKQPRTAQEEKQMLQRDQRATGTSPPPYRRYAPLILRLGISVVFLWFGFTQLKNPASWTRMVPAAVSSILHISTTTLIYLNGAFEVVMATLLLLGLRTRLIATLLALHLLGITSIVGYGPTGARDLALALATAS